MKIRSLSANRKRLASALFSSVLGFGVVLGTALPVPAADAMSNRMVTYKGEGRTLFALSLLPTKPLPVLQTSRVAIVVDTSASQNGDFRTDSIEVAQSIVEALPESSVVCLLACDVEPVVLSQASSPTSKSIAEGFKKLEKRVPLGTTDLAGALRAARRELGDQPDGNIIYIGDGIHLSNLLSTAEFESLIDGLRDSRTTVHSLAIGPQTDCELLAVFSSHTGGKILVRQNITNATCQQIGSELAKSTLASVFWPKKASWPKGISNVIPSKLPPLRLDRDSIVIGNLSGESFADNLTIEGTVSGKAISMEWELKSEPSNPDFAFLTQVLAKATPNAGLLLPTPGSESLREVGLLLANTSEQLVKDARFALTAGETDSAISIAREALKRSPNSLSAQNILDAAEQSRKSKPVNKPVKSTEQGRGGSRGIVKFVSAQIGDDQPPRTLDPFGDDPSTLPVPLPATPAPVIPAPVITSPTFSAPPSGIPPNVAPSGFGAGGSIDDGFGELANAADILAEDEGQRRVAAQHLEALVKSELMEARKTRDPASTKMSLKSLQDQIRRASELDAGGRSRLESQVASAIQAAARAEATRRDDLSRREAVQSSQSVSKRLLAENERRSSTVQQLVERYNSLMAQQLFAAANTEIAPQITQIDRDSLIDRVTNIESNIAANEQLIRDVVSRRQRAFVDTLYLNELAFIPFVDEPPVRYPPADVWQALSARRLERYGSIDLSGGKETERAIFKSLNERGEVAFNAQPLSGVMKFFSDTYAIPIVIDDKALEEENITRDEPITLNLPAISFRSALKLILEPLQLTYVIQDEVMRITGKKTSANVVRVYPVGDLVVPVMSSGGGGIGGGFGGGGQGGGGFGGGGQGGGFGGGGVGGGGQGGGGFGGGGQGGGGLF